MGVENFCFGIRTLDWLDKNEFDFSQVYGVKSFEMKSCLLGNPIFK